MGLEAQVFAIPESIFPVRWDTKQSWLDQAGTLEVGPFVHHVFVG